MREILDWAFNTRRDKTRKDFNSKRTYPDRSAICELTAFCNSAVDCRSTRCSPLVGGAALLFIPKGNSDELSPIVKGTILPRVLWRIIMERISIQPEGCFVFPTPLACRWHTAVH